MKFLALGCALIAAAPALAQDAPPPPAAGDARIRVIPYDAGAVVPLQVMQGYQLTLEFAPDEVIENVALGDAGGWQVTPNKRGDRLFVKPAGGGPTNMTVMTDQRTYAFDLSAGGGGGAVYVLRFDYPGAAAAAATAAPSLGPGRYKLSGTRAIRPDAISDDGRRTYIVWRADQTMPAVFAIDRNGQEALTNGAMRDGRYVIDSVANRLVFRLDRDLAGAMRVPQVKP